MGLRRFYACGVSMASPFLAALFEWLRRLTSLRASPFSLTLFEWLKPFLSFAFLAGEQKVSRAFWLLAFESVRLSACEPLSPPKYFAVSDNILVKFAFANQ